MGLDMYLYKNKRIEENVRTDIEGKTFNWDDPTVERLKKQYTITVATADNTKPIPEAIKQVATEFYINNEGFIPMDIVKAYNLDITEETYNGIDIDKNENDEFVINVYSKTKVDPDVIVISNEEIKKYLTIEKHTYYIYDSEEIMYWRKANQIRQWFVDNLSEPVENCSESTVTKENLEKLISDCKEVLNNKEKAKDIIPTKGGFFFGSTEYDEYYFDDIEHTLEHIKAILVGIDWEKESLYYSEWW